MLKSPTKLAVAHPKILHLKWTLHFSLLHGPGGTQLSSPFTQLSLLDQGITYNEDHHKVLENTEMARSGGKKVEGGGWQSRQFESWLVNQPPPGHVPPQK